MSLPLALKHVNERKVFLIPRGVLVFSCPFQTANKMPKKSEKRFAFIKALINARKKLRGMDPFNWERKERENVLQNMIPSDTSAIAIVEKELKNTFFHLVKVKL